MFTFLHVRFFSSSLNSLLTNIEGRMLLNKPFYMCVTSLHGVTLAQHHLRFRRILNHAGFNVSDGMPIVWVGKAAKKKEIERIYGPDLMVSLCRLAEQNKWGVLLYGTTESTLKQLKQKLKEQFPRLSIVGTIAPPFRELTNKEKIVFLKKINNAKPNIVFVGMSTPKQETWMYDARPHLHAKALIGVGAAFDFISGTKRQAPLLIRQIGFEWLFRLVYEPRRLSKRYTSIISTLFMIPVNKLCDSIKKLLKMNGKKNLHL